MKRTKKGFTLIELIVVLAIIAIIAAIAVPTAFGSIEKARIAADSATVDSINSAVRVYSALQMADSTATPSGTVGDALTQSAMTLADEWQHTGSGVDWNPGASAGQPGSFLYKSTGGTITDIKAIAAVDIFTPAA